VTSIKAQEVLHDIPFGHEKKAYKEAMSQLQADYYEQVSVKFGLTRIGPRRQHLTRLQWKEQKSQAVLLAKAHSDVQKFASNARAIVERHVAEQTAKAETATQKRIHNIEAQSYHRIKVLKHMAIERIGQWKNQAIKLKRELEARDAVIAAQAEELRVAMDLLQAHGIGSVQKI
jgi:hypothetical protein